VDLVRIAECASDRIHNTSPTAASMGSDLNGMATLNACEQIFERVKELLPGGRDYRPHPSLPPTYPHYGWVTACYWAYQRQISLGALGFYGSPFGGTYKWRAHSLDGDGRVSVSEPGEVDNAGRGEVYNYYAFGAACAEVELDVLTGNWRFLRADLLMDVGESLNAAIDVGQVEGAFVQGVGRWTSESVVWVDGAHAGLGPAGSLHTDSPHRYFVPGAADAPRDFRVTLLGGAPNPRAVHSSKAVGEPPFFLSSAAYFALKDAVRAARTDAMGEDEGGAYVQLHAPLTAERLRMACRDRLSRPENGRGEYVANCTSY
jgi:xanthine dehydrogenase/oxidase